MAMSDQERAEKLQQVQDRFALLQPYLTEGVTVTHTVCLGILKEHVLTDVEQLGMGPIGMIWLCGYPTGDTMRQMEEGFVYADDISPLNVTHVNRIPVEALPAIGTPVDTPFQLFDATIEDVTDEQLAAMAAEERKCPKCGEPIDDDDLPF